MAMTPKFWENLCAVLDLQHLLEDARFSTPADRRENREALTKLLDDRFGQDVVDNWLPKLHGKVPVAPVNTLKQALDNPFVAETGMTRTADDMTLLGAPVRVNGARASGALCPEPGALNAATLKAAGLSDTDIASLLEQAT